MTEVSTDSVGLRSVRKESPNLVCSCPMFGGSSRVSADAGQMYTLE